MVNRSRIKNVVHSQPTVWRFYTQANQVYKERMLRL
jgi:hypothetical protein